MAYFHCHTYNLQKPYYCVTNAYNEIEMTFDTLLEQKFKAGLGMILIMAAKSSLELKYEAPKSRSGVFECQEFVN
jgi:hypothetical protein